MMNYFFLGISLFFASQLQAQFKLDGRVEDRMHQQPIPNARIYLLETGQLTMTDSLGCFSLSTEIVVNATLLLEANGFVSKQFYLEAPVKTTLTFGLDPSHINEVDEVKLDVKSIEISNRHLYSVEAYKLTSLSRISTVNLGEALTKIPGVYQSSTGNGISKPVIRGMQGMRVITLVNGLRMEGQQWGGDHGMGLSALGIGSIEVIKGPASLLFGADALGGVLYFVDEPYAQNGKQSFDVQQAFHSATMGSSSSFLWKKSGAKYRAMIGLSEATHADFRLPNQLYAYNTRFQELALKVGVSWNNANSVQHLRLMSNQVKTGIPGESSDSLLMANGFESMSGGRTLVLPTQFFYNHIVSFEKKWFFVHNELSLLGGQTLNQLKEFEDSFSEKAMNMNLWNSIFQVKWTKKWTDKTQLTSGYQGMFQSNRNDQNALEILMPNAHTLDQGIFSILKVQFKEKYQFAGGLRMDIRKLEVKENTNSQGSLNRYFASPNGSIAWKVQTSKKMNWQVAASTGYRAPHVTELLANGFHHGALRYEVGNVKLKSERALQMDWSMNYQSEHLEWTINPFYTFFRQYIYLNPIDSIIGGMPVFQYQQMDHVQMFGIDINIHSHFHRIEKLHLENNFSYLRFANASSQSVSLVPQPRLSNVIRYQMDVGNKWKLSSLECTQSSFFKQNQVATFEKPSSYYQLIHASVHIQHIGKHFMDVEFSVKNILNENYIDHLSRLKNIDMPSQGRSFVLSVKWKLAS